MICRSLRNIAKEAPPIFLKQFAANARDEHKETSVDDTHRPESSPNSKQIVPIHGIEVTRRKTRGSVAEIYNQAPWQSTPLC